MYGLRLLPTVPTRLGQASLHLPQEPAELAHFGPGQRLEDRPDPVVMRGDHGLYHGVARFCKEQDLAPALRPPTDEAPALEPCHMLSDVALGHSQTRGAFVLIEAGGEAHFNQNV